MLFYLLVYGVTNTGAFAVLACLERSSHGETVEAEDIGDLRGLCKTNPWLGWSMVLCMLSLLGFPPILGFFGKVPLFTSALGAGRVTLVVILGINSAIAAFYYLRVVATVMLEEPADTGVHDTGVHDTGVHDTGVRDTGVPSRVLGAVVSGVCVVAFSIFGNSFMSASTKAGEPRVFGEAESTSQHETPEQEAVGALGSQVQSATVVTPKKIRMH